MINMGSTASVADARPINSSPCPLHSSICAPITRLPNVLYGTVELAEVTERAEGPRAMSPKMTCKETEAVGREIQAERHW
ncbi:hypothetical protein VD0002_g9771 [Verticillium dahliae]|nr:hypothetical protein VD0003_g9153 [Verticillium dahliae]PNH56741.1 hypothetical protein VD0002_g9771 [Verticillium dahliae]